MKSGTKRAEKCESIYLSLCFCFRVDTNIVAVYLYLIACYGYLGARKIVVGKYRHPLNGAKPSAQASAAFQFICRFLSDEDPALRISSCESREDAGARTWGLVEAVGHAYGAHLIGFYENPGHSISINRCLLLMKEQWSELRRNGHTLPDGCKREILALVSRIPPGDQAKFTRALCGLFVSAGNPVEVKRREKPSAEALPGRPVPARVRYDQISGGSVRL